MAERDPDWWATPGTQRAKEIQQQQAQRGVLGNLQAGAQETAAADILELGIEEGGRLLEETRSTSEGFDPVGAVTSALTNLGIRGLGVLGARAGDEEDYSDKYEELTTGVPMQYWDEILDEPNLPAAQRARARVTDQLQRAQISAQQQGITQNLAMIAGGIVDVDAPLMFMTGGGYKAASVARQTLRASQRIGLSPAAALRASSAAVGASAGLQAGALVGATQVGIRETADWTLVADAALQGLVLGGAVNPLLGGDIQLGARAAQDELYSRMARDDMPTSPNVDAGNAERLHPEDHQGPVVFEDEAPLTATRDAPLVESTVGARMVRPTPGAQTTPVTGVSEEVADLSQMMDNWRHDSQWQDWKIAEQDEWWAKVATEGRFNPLVFSTSDFRTLYKSESSGMNWLLGNVFESPNGLGRGRYTAAAGMEMYHRRIAQQFAQPLEQASKDWARRNGALGPLGNPDEASVRTFNREVMLEMNDRALGRTPPTRDQAVIKAADALDKAGEVSIDIGKGAPGQLAVDGFDNIPKRSGYSPYVWNGQKLLKLERDGVVDRKAVVDGLAQAYRLAGIEATKDAHAVAKAVVDRAAAKGEDINTNLIGLLSGDGREWLNTALETSGMPVAEREALMRRLTGDVEERGKESFAKTRNDIDLNHSIQTKDGSDLRVVDLMNQDLHGVWQRYTRRLAGSAALARVGITNRTQIENVIQAIHAQQRAIGEELVDGDRIRAMFSHFEGGPIKGWSAISGRLEDGVLPEAALLKRMTNLSLLGKLGLAQLAETGASIAATGFENWYNRTLREMRKDMTNDVLDDLAFMMGDLGADHRMFAEHLDLDDMNASDKGQWFQYVNGLSQKGQYYQGYVSGFNHVRSHQQRVAAAAITDKIFRAVKAELDAGNRFLTDEGLRTRMRADLGLFDEDFTYLFDLVESGVIEFQSYNGKTFVNRINPDQWDADQALTFGAAITRNMNQVVQKSMAGEADAWMHTTVGSLITHLKTFPLQAMQKQFIRNARHMDQQGLNTVLMGMATAGAAVMIRDLIDGRERDPADLAKAALGYSNMTGWVPMAVDPVMTMLGLEDYRINQYGPHSQATVPALDWTNRAMRLPGAAADQLTGQADWHDEQSLRALPYANTVFLSWML
jgi:hypothetical protein